jgi:peptide chain release factor 3
VHLFDREGHGEKVIQERVVSLDEAQRLKRLSDSERAELEGEVALLDEAGDAFDLDKVLRGQLTPMFFGSAMNNFGVSHFLRALHRAGAAAGGAQQHDWVSRARSRRTSRRSCSRSRRTWTRRRTATASRSCACARASFRKDMTATHVRLGKKIKLTKPSTFMARERNEVETAYAGDIIGMFDPGHFRIGDAVCEGKPLEFDGIPQFAPEHFAIARPGRGGEA